MKYKFIVFKVNNLNEKIFGVDFINGRSTESVSDNFINKLQGLSAYEEGRDFIIEEIEVIDKKEYDKVVAELNKLKRK